MSVDNSFFKRSRFRCLFLTSASIIVAAIFICVFLCYRIDIFGLAKVGISLFRLHVDKNFISHRIFLSFVRFLSIRRENVVVCCPCFFKMYSKILFRASSLVRKIKTRSFNIFICLFQYFGQYPLAVFRN